MKVLLLGGTGFLGQTIAAFCDDKKIKYAAVGRENYDQFRGSSWDVLINANGNSKKFLADRDPVGEFDLSVNSVMRSFKDFSFKRYVLISTIAVYPDAKDQTNNHEDVALNSEKQSHYGFHKYCAEKLVEHYCPDWLILRLGGLVGPGMKKGPVFDILHGGPLWVSRESEFQFIDTRSVARFIFLLLRKKTVRNQVFNLCGRGTVRLADVEHWARQSCTLAERTPKEIWNINSDKLHRLIKLPKTEETVSAYVREVLARGGT